MQLVVMAALLALGGAGLVPDCRYDCRLDAISVNMESEECGTSVSIQTTSCSGHCFTQDLVYRSVMMNENQTTCNIREWSYKTIDIPGCPEGVDPRFTYPVAEKCECKVCDTDNTDCGAISLPMPGCLSR